MTQANGIIPVQVAPGEPKATNLAIADGVLNEIKDALAELIDSGKTGVIDLRLKPHMRAETYEHLRGALSRGEVTAVVDANLRIEIAETGYPGVWWLTHRNEQGAIVTEFIEITVMPEILKPHFAEIRAGRDRLAHALAATAPPGEPLTAGDSG
jgi:hydrogenase-1 operon protein HyaF